MLLRVELGKGRRDRNAMLSPDYRLRVGNVASQPLITVIRLLPNCPDTGGGHTENAIAQSPACRPAACPGGFTANLPPPPLRCGQ